MSSIITLDDYYRRQRKLPLILYSNISLEVNNNISPDLFYIESFA